MNLLVIALEFPPIQAAGAFRPLRFVTHLPKFGIRPVVVTFNPAQLADGQAHNLNPALAARVPADTPIYLLDLSVIEPERRSGSNPPTEDFRGVRCGSLDELFARLKTEHAIDAIWATCPPFNVSGLALAARKALKKPLILDMRDAWSQWGSAPFRTWLHYRRVLRDEVSLMNAADAVVCVTPQLAEMQQRLTPKARSDFYWIPNAYDFEVQPPSKVILSPESPRVRVSYAGQFYFNSLHEDADGIIPWYRKMPHRWLHYYATQQRWIYRTPYFFLRSWARLRQTEPELGDRLEFHYVGQLPSWLPEMADAFGLGELCTWHGAKPKQQAQEIIDNSDALLSTSIKVLDGKDYCLASKTFDYIAAGKPVLGFVCPGAQRDFLVDSGIAVLFDPDDTDGSAQQLGELVQNGVTRRVDLSYLETYSSLSTTRRLAEVIGQVAIGSVSRLPERTAASPTSRAIVDAKLT
jgi:glycosyltransferase involved in cell wall biosynthesis